MIVHVLIVGWYYASLEVVGVFSTHEAAERAFARYKKCDFARVEQHRIDAPMDLANVDPVVLWERP